MVLFYSKHPTNPIVAISWLQTKPVNVIDHCNGRHQTPQQTKIIVTKKSGRGTTKNIFCKNQEMNFTVLRAFVLPVFGIEEDEKTTRIFEDLFKGYLIKTINSNEIANQGGVLNFIT